jgi:hypothetical protein
MSRHRIKIELNPLNLNAYLYLGFGAFTMQTFILALTLGHCYVYIVNKEIKVKFVGTKYNKDLSTTQIAALIRLEIKAAVKSGILPKAKYSVRSAHFAGGSSIDIRIKSPSFTIMNPKRIELETRDSRYQWQTYESEPRYTAEASSTLNKIKEILTHYNFDDSDSMTDYFHVNFYGGVKFDWRDENAERERVVATIHSSQSVA